MPLVFLSTFPTLKDARAFAKIAVQQNLCACINIFPKVESHYIWEKKLQKIKEFLIMGKTTSDKSKELEALLLKKHPYEVPEFLVFKITDGNSSYLNWISQINLEK